MGKLQTRWLGPYEIDEVFPNGAVWLTTIDPIRFKILVNGHRLRLYHKPATKEQFLQQFTNQVQTTASTAFEKVPATSKENPLATVPTTSREDIMDAVPTAGAFLVLSLKFSMRTFIITIYILYGNIILR